MNAERIGKGSRPFPNPGALSDCRCMRKATRQDPRISTQGVGPKGRGLPRPEGAIQSAGSPTLQVHANAALPRGKRGLGGIFSVHHTISDFLAESGMGLFSPPFA